MLRALAFLTVLGPRRGAPRGRDLPFFPLVGALVGLVVGGVWYWSQQVFPALVAAAVVLAADAAITGMLHLDGVADSGDGLIAPMDRQRRLDVMRDPSIGAFGVTAVVIVLLLRLAAFASVTAAPLTVAALWCLARTAMAVVVCTVPYARGDGGLAASVRSGSRAGRAWLTGLIGLLLAAALAVIEGGAWLLLPLAVAALAAAGVTVLARARLGGFTGDTLGAAGVLAETAGLVTLTAL